MSRSAELMDAIKRSFDGNAWHGPALQEVLADLTAEEAAWHPARQVHSIWDLTLHVAAWADEVAKRLRGRAPQEPDAGDWPTCEKLDSADWEAAVQRVLDARDQLLATVREQSEGDLDTIVGGSIDPALGTGFSRYAMVLGLVQHNAYHAGQMMLLKKQIRAV